VLGEKLNGQTTRQVELMASEEDGYNEIRVMAKNNVETASPSGPGTCTERF
jgi:hypothetical protein